VNWDARLHLTEQKRFTDRNQISFFEPGGDLSSLMTCYDERCSEPVCLPAIHGARLIDSISRESDLTQESKLAPYQDQLTASVIENRVFTCAADAPADLADLRSSSHVRNRILSDDRDVIGVIKDTSSFGRDILNETLPRKPRGSRRPPEELTVE